MKITGISILTLMALAMTKTLSNPLMTTHCGKPADVVFVIDTSSSIWPGDFKNYALTFIQNVVSMFDVGPDKTQTRVGAVTFSDDVRLEFHLNGHQEKQDLLFAISRIRSRGGNTYTNRALKYVHENMFQSENGGRQGVAHIIIVLTDGRSSNNPGTVMEAESARRSGAAIFAIGVGEAEELELTQIASEPVSQFKFKVTDYAALDSIKVELALKACEVTLPPTTPTTTTTTTTTTTIAPPTTTTTTTTTTEAPNVCGGLPADIFFVLDSSSSIWRMDFEKRMLGFVRDMVSNFDIGHDFTRVGVITFSDKPRLVIGLDSHTKKQDLVDAISPSVVRYTLGGTNTAEALEEVRRLGFHESIAREGVTKIAIVITDGQSWNEKKTRKEAELLKESGVLVYAIGVGKGVKQEELEGIANQPKDEFVFSVDGFAALSELKDVLAIKACGNEEPQGDQPVCGNGPVDVTVAFDAGTMTVENKLHALDQLQTVTKRLTTLSNDVKLEVASGPCPQSMDIPISSPEIANLRIRRMKPHIRSNLHGIVKEWRYKTVGDTKTSYVDGLEIYNPSSSFSSDSNKGLVLLLNKENIPEFGHLAEEVLALIDNGVDVLVVLDKSIGKTDIEGWLEILGHRRVVSGVDLDTDFSGYIMEFVCSL